jgi:uncharacterized membrane protein
VSTGYPSPYNAKYIALTQAMIIGFSLVNSFYPKYFIEFYVLYFVVFLAISGVMMYRSNPMLRDRKYISEAIKSRTIYEEKNVDQLIQSDQDYMKQMMAQASKSMKMLGLYVLFLIVVYLVYSQGINRIQSEPAIRDNALLRFAVFIAVYEIMYLSSFLLYRRGGLASLAGSMVMAPRSYRITEKGIVSTDQSRTVLHLTHLKESEVQVNRDKKYIEIVPRGNGRSMPFRLRLYSNDVDKVSELVNRIKRLASREEERK